MTPALIPFVWPLLGALLGLIIGSFLATLVLRWPAGRPLSGRSVCDGCGRRLGAAELVPLMSWAGLGGRCRSCGSRIDWRHPVLEAAAAIIGALAFWAAPGLAGLSGALLGWLLLALLALDCEHYWLPDALVWPLLGLGLLLGLGGIEQRLLGAAIGGGALLLVALGYRALRGREGLGMGDVKLMAALGAWLSLERLPPLLLGATLIGLLLVGLAAARGKRPGLDSRIPFGACLCAAAFPIWLVAVAGQPG